MKYSKIVYIFLVHLIMDFKAIDKKLKTNGYVVIPNMLSDEEIEIAKNMFYDWQTSVPRLAELHSKIDPHGIYKFHEVGHQRHAWYLRTRPQIQDIFKKLWNTDELVVGFDGSSYIPKEFSKKDSVWTHVDQAPNKIGLECYQGFVALTDNKERTLVVYEGSHLLYEHFCHDFEITGNKNWQIINKKYLDTIYDKKRVLHVPAGALVLWDSRTFHQNQYGQPKSEERMIQYLCYLPKNSPKNTAAMQKKRRLYFKERRTTSHWPYPIKVNGKQPQTYGDNSKLIDYEFLPPINLEDMMSDIEALL